jgi:hypothetical protein
MEIPCMAGASFPIRRPRGESEARTARHRSSGRRHSEHAVLLGDHDLAAILGTSAANPKSGAARVCELRNRDTSAFLTLALGRPAPFGVSGSLWLPRSRESRYHFSAAHGSTHNSHIIPDHAHVYARTLFGEACDPWRRLPRRSFVTRPDLERVPMALDDRSGFHLSGLPGASGGPPSEGQAASPVRRGLHARGASAAAP